MNRLIKKANHVSPFMHEDVIEDVKDNDRTKRRGASDSYLIARQLIGDLPVTPTAHTTLKLSKFIDEGKFSDLGNSKENWDAWVERTKNILKDEKILIANKKSKLVKRAFYTVRQIVDTVGSENELRIAAKDLPMSIGQLQLDLKPYSMTAEKVDDMIIIHNGTGKIYE